MSAAVTSSLEPLFCPSAGLPYEQVAALRAAELDVSYAMLLCVVRAAGIGVRLFYDRSTHEIVEIAATGATRSYVDSARNCLVTINLKAEVRYDAGRFEGWATP